MVSLFVYSCIGNILYDVHEALEQISPKVLDFYFAVE